MAVLTQSEILKRINSGEIKIEPFNKKSLGPASYDLHLGNKFRVFKGVKNIFKVTEKADFDEITKLVTVDKYFLLMPAQTVHGITQEKITLPDNICARIEGRSRFGRLGLMVHITSGFVQPGTVGFQVLEMNNAGPMPLSLPPGIAICQIIFEECRGEALYMGRFKDQISP